MSHHNYILFDLDGTLTDPTEEMLSAAKYALEHFNIHENDPKKLACFLQEPLLRCFEEHFGMTGKQADQAFQHYWYYAGTFGPKQCLPYEGIEPMLQNLHKANKTLCIATARKTRNAEQILKVNGMQNLFTHVVGVSEDDTRRNKKMVVFDLLAALGDYDEKDVLMVGDRVADITAAHDNGIESLAVTYGQETTDEITGAKPTYIVESVQQMAEFLQA